MKLTGARETLRSFQIRDVPLGVEPDLSNSVSSLGEWAVITLIHRLNVLKSAQRNSTYYRAVYKIDFPRILLFFLTSFSSPRAMPQKSSSKFEDFSLGDTPARHHKIWDVRLWGQGALP